MGASREGRGNGDALEGDGREVEVLLGERRVGDGLVEGDDEGVVPLVGGDGQDVGLLVEAGVGLAGLFLAEPDADGDDEGLGLAESEADRQGASGPQAAG